MTDSPVPNGGSVTKLAALPVGGDLKQILIAGRRAAYTHLLAKIAEFARSINPTALDILERAYDGESSIQFGGIDLGPIVDAAVLEAIARSR